MDTKYPNSGLSAAELDDLYKIDVVKRYIKQQLGSDTLPGDKYTRKWIDDALKGGPKFRQAFNSRFAFEPEQAVRNKYDRLGRELADAWVSSKHYRKPLLERIGLKTPIPIHKLPAAIEEQASFYDAVSTLDPKVKDIIEQRKAIRMLMTHAPVKVTEEGEIKEGTFAGNISTALYEFGIGGRSFDTKQGMVKTGGLYNIVGGLSDTAIFGASLGKTHSMTDEEAAAFLNMKAQTDPFFAELTANKEYQAGKKNVLDTTLHTAAYVLGIAPEFAVIGKGMKAVEGLKAFSNLSKVKGFQPVLRQLVRLDRTGKVARTFFSLASHSAESAMQFGIHSLATGRPEQMLESMQTGAVIGFGGKLFSPRFVSGRPMNMLRAMTGAGLGNTAVMWTAAELQGGGYDVNRGVADFIVGFGLYGTRFSSANTVEKLNENIKANTGINIIEELGRKRGGKYIRRLAKAEMDRLAVEKWNNILGLTEHTQGGKKVPATDPNTVDKTVKMSYDAEKAVKNDRVKQSQEPVAPKQPLLDEGGVPVKIEPTLIPKHEAVPAKEAAKKAAPAKEMLNPVEQIKRDIEMINAQVKEIDSRDAVKNITVDYGAKDQALRSISGKFNTFVETVANNRKFDIETRNKLFRDLDRLTKSTDNADAFIREAQKLVTNYDLDFRALPETGETSLRRIYHEFKDRAVYGSEGQFSRVTLSFDKDGLKIRDAMQTKEFSDMSDMIEYKSLASEKLGSRIAIFENVEVGGKMAKISSLSENDLQQVTNGLYKRGGFLLPFRSDSGKGFVSKKHERFSNRKAVASAEKALSGLIPENATQMHKDHAINTHFYLQDLLGENYIDHVKASGQLSNIADLTKRFQIITSKGTKHESASFYNIEGVDVVNGQARLKSKVIPDMDVVTGNRSRITDTDGICYVSGNVFNALLRDYGTEGVENLGHMKSFVYQDPNFNPQQGAFLGKLKLTRATPDIQKQMDAEGLHLLFHDSAAKYRGNRKVGEVFEITPESIRTQFTEHQTFTNEFGVPTPSKVNLFRQTIYYVQDKVVSKYKERAVKRLNDEIALASQSPENFAKWFKEDVMKRLSEWNGESSELEALDFAKVRGVAEKMYETMDWSKIGLTSPMTRDFTINAIQKYLTQSVLSPEIRGHLGVLSGMPEWCKAGNAKVEGMLGRQITKPSEIMVGSGYRDFLIRDLLKSNSIDVYRNGKKVDNKSLLAKNYKTLGDLFKNEKGVEVEVATIRAPAEDVGGVRSQRIVGIGPDGTGSATYMEPREFNFLGGADSDFDKVAIYFEDGAQWKKALVNKYGNENYIKDTKDAFERRELPQQRMAARKVGVKGGKPEINPDIYDPVALTNTAKTILNAKDSIGRLMSLDRTMRTMIDRGHKLTINNQTLEPLKGQQYDEAMLYWKRTAVDAKHGGFGDWKQVRNEIVNQIYGHSDAASHFFSSKDYADTASLYSTVFSRNFRENRAWTPQERKAAIDNYFKNRTPVNQLEQFVKDIPRIDASNISDVDAVVLKKALESAKISTGGLRYLELMQKHSLLNPNNIAKVSLTPELKSDAFNNYFANIDNTSPNPYSVQKRDRAIHRVEDVIFKRTNRKFIQREGETKNDYVKRLKGEFEKHATDAVYRDMLTDMQVKADDFMVNDVHSIVSKQWLEQLDHGGRISAEEKAKVKQLINHTNMLSNQLYKQRGVNREKINVEMNQTLCALNEMVKSNGTREFADYVGVHFLGSVYDPKAGLTDSVNKMQWTKWMDEGFAQRYGFAVKEFYNRLVKASPKKTVMDVETPVKEISKEIAVKLEVPEKTKQMQKEIDFRTATEKTADLPKGEIERINKLEIEAATKFLSNLTNKKDAPTDYALKKAKVAMKKMLLNPLSPWTTGREFVTAFVDRPSAELYNFDKYPLTAKELTNMVIKAKDVQRDLKLLAQGDGSKLSKTFWKAATSKTIMEKAPETYKIWNGWFEDTNKYEAKLSQMRATVNGVISELYPIYKNLEKSGEIVKDIIETGKPNMKGLTQREIAAHKIAAKKVQGVFDEVFPYLESGYSAYVDNVVARLPEKIGAQVKETMLGKFHKREGYFTHFVKIRNELARGQALEVVDQYRKGLINAEELVRQVGGSGHTKQRKQGVALALETDLEKVMFTYLENTIPWALKQKMERTGREGIKALNQKIDYMAKTGKDISFVTKLANYTDKLADSATGRYDTMRDMQLITAKSAQVDPMSGNIIGVKMTPELPGEKAQNFLIQYRDPEGNTQYKSLGKVTPKQAGELYLRHKMNLGYRIAQNVTNSILGTSFVWNIGANISSSARNHAQKIYPVWMTSFNDWRSLRSWKKGDITFEIIGQDGKITKRDYNSVLAEAKRLAGLEYAQMQGQTGEVLEHTSMSHEIFNELAGELNNTIAARTYRVTDKIARAVNRIAEVSGTGEVARRGKTVGMPFRDVLAFSKVEVGNRGFAFELGFHPVFRELFYNYKLSGLNDQDAMNLATRKAVKAGERMVEFTQYDYHNYNAPEALRGAGLSGLNKRMWLQFKKFPINYYTMVRKLMTDSITAAQINPGRKKILNAQAGKLASMIATHAVIAGVSYATGLGFDNYVQEDQGAWAFDTWNWLVGSDNISYWAEQETPIPYALGPVYGKLASYLMMANEISNIEQQDWIRYNAFPRGPRKQVEIGLDLVDNIRTGSGWRSLSDMARLVGLNHRYRR